MIVNDTLQQTAGMFTRCMISTWVNRGLHVIVLCFDQHPRQFLHGFPDDISNRLMVHDGFTDPFGDENPRAELQCNPETWEKLVPETEHCVILIESLSTVLLHEDFHHIYSTLLHLSRNSHVQQTVCIVHTDVHDDSLLASLEYLATTVVTLKPAANAADLSAVCHTVHRKPGGKIIREEERFDMTPELTICNITKIEQKKAQKETQAQPDPTANLTFNLRLSKGEKDARDQVVLPYLKKPPSVPTSGTGEITYTMDRDDDFDEEDDPDDDLTF